MGSALYWPEEITETRLLLVEGADAYWFSRWALRAYGLSGFQVMDFGGITALPRRLKLLKLITGFERVESLAIMRDAETSASSAAESIRGALTAAELPVPEAELQIEPGPPKTAFLVFHDMPEGDGPPTQGCLEDLCLGTVRDEPVMECVGAFLKCAEDAGCDIRRRHKAQLHAYLAANDKSVGLKLGEAAKVGTWDWEHPLFKPLRELLSSL